MEQKYLKGADIVVKDAEKSNNPVSKNLFQNIKPGNEVKQQLLVIYTRYFIQYELSYSKSWVFCWKYNLVLSFSFISSKSYCLCVNAFDSIGCGVNVTEDFPFITGTNQRHVQIQQFLDKQKQKMIKVTLQEFDVLAKISGKIKFPILLLHLLYIMFFIFIRKQL